MLKDILSISGKPGLFKLLSTTNTTFVVESLTDKRRMAVTARERVVSLKEISVYTQEGDIALAEVLEKIRLKEQGKEVDLKAIGTEKQDLFHYFEEVLPLFDKNMVHANEIKKMLTWYNLLIASGFDSFVEEEENGETSEANPENSTPHSNEGEN